MIQLFLTLLLIVILIIIIIIRTKEPFYQKCSKNLVLNAKNDIYDEKPCIKLIPNPQLPPNNLSGYILIKKKNENISDVIKLAAKHMINENEIKLTSEDNIVLGETYLITLNVMNDSGKLDVYNTVEITFRNITLSDGDLNIKHKSNRDKLIEKLKTKKIILSL